MSVSFYINVLVETEIIWLKQYKLFDICKLHRYEKQFQSKSSQHDVSCVDEVLSFNREI